MHVVSNVSKALSVSFVDLVGMLTLRKRDGFTGISMDDTILSIPMADGTTP